MHYMRDMTPLKMEVHVLCQFINLLLMFSTIRIMRQISLLLLRPETFTLELTTLQTIVLEQRLAALEGGIAAVVTASGTSAIATSLLTLLKAGDHIVASSSLYGGTYNLLSVTLPRHGITTTFVDPSDAENFKNAAQENTRAFFIESLGNPKLDVLDIQAISNEAKAYKVPLIVDNTVATPYLLNPIEHGANIVIHSLTKYINGNGTALGGVIIDAGTFDWANGKFPEFTEPSARISWILFTAKL